MKDVLIVAAVVFWTITGLIGLAAVALIVEGFFE